LGTAFQVVLFVLPGFLLIQVFLLFIPTRAAGGDAQVIAWSVAASALLWLLASAVLVGVSATIGVASYWWTGQAWNPDLWDRWIKPTITVKEVTGADLLPGLVLSALGVLFGFLGAVLMQLKGGRVRVIHFWRLRRLRFDLNPKVWSWFLQEPVKGMIYRVTLKSGRVFYGQISAYSTDPNDDSHEIVLRCYSQEVKGEPNSVPVNDSAGMLVSRADVELIEQLRFRLSDDGKQILPIADQVGGQPSPPSAANGRVAGQAGSPSTRPDDASQSPNERSRGWRSTLG
jgi:Family of unknown function (DUF6338)